jgi:hypothetical protein
MTRRTLEILAVCIALLIAALTFHAWLASHDDQLRLQATLASQKVVLDAADARERDRSAELKDSLAQIESLKRQVLTPEQILRELPRYLQLPQPIKMSTASNSNEGAVSSPPTENTPGASESDTQAPPSTPQRGTASPLKKLLNELHLFAGGTEKSPAASDARALPTGATHQSSAPSIPVGRIPSSTPAGIQRPVPASSPSQDLNHDAKNPVTADSIVQALNDSSSTSSATAEIPAADLKPLYDFVQDCRACQVRLAAAKQDASDNALKITALTRERDAAVTAAKGGSFWLRLRRNSHWLVIGAVASAGMLCGTGHCR